MKGPDCKKVKRVRSALQTKDADGRRLEIKRQFPAFYLAKEPGKQAGGGALRRRSGPSLAGAADPDAAPPGSASRLQAASLLIFW